MIVSNSIVVYFIILVLLIILLMFGGIKVYKSTKKRRGKWGINLNPVQKWTEKGVLKNVSCPVCGSEQEQIRKPQNLHEILWGGWTCSKCGASINKWGQLRN